MSVTWWKDPRTGRHGVRQERVQVLPDERQRSFQVVRFLEQPRRFGPPVSTLDLRTSTGTGLAVVDATSAVATLDSGLGRKLVGLGTFLLRTESVSSSRIGNVHATRNDFAKAVAGIKFSREAKTTLAAATALASMIRLGGSGEIALADMLEAHRLLMKDDWNEKAYAGRVRDVQNWIGGSDYNPCAVYIPPPAALVDTLMDDLIRYANRDGIPAITQAAIAHAQFESIHPFSDGNGRIGRALISARRRRRQLAQRTVVPVASAMLVTDWRRPKFSPLTQSARDHAWMAVDVLDEIDNMNLRVGQRITASAALSARPLPQEAGSASVTRVARPFPARLDSHRA